MSNKVKTEKKTLSNGEVITVQKSPARATGYFKKQTNLGGNKPTRKPTSK